MGNKECKCTFNVGVLNTILGTTCDNCLQSTATIKTHDDSNICSDCYDEKYSTCARCDTVEHIDNMLSTDMGYLCEGCEGDLR